MRVAVFGATGRTGSAVVEEVVRRGATALACARTADQREWPEGVEAVRADITSADDVSRALDDADRVVVAVGAGASRTPTTIYSAGTAHILSALAAQDRGKPLSVVSAVPAAPPDELSAGARVGASVLSLFFGASYLDMRKMEAELAASARDWVCLRPPRLVGRPAQGTYQLARGGRAGSITHGDLASALLDVLEDPTRFRQAWFASG